jgi:hypothetical protein
MNHCTPVETHVATRRTRNCEWCWERIKIGDEYKRYRFFDGGHAYTVYAHPECYVAICDMAREEGGWCEWTPGMDRPASLSVSTQEVTL